MMTADPFRPASLHGFERAAFERASLWIHLLDGIRRHPFIGPRVVLKGGAALNLFDAELVRVPLDVDFNYVGARGRDEMLRERPLFFTALKEVVAALRLDQSGIVEGHINFLLRTSLWPSVRRDSMIIGGDCARQIAMQDIHETAAAKLATVLSRGASRDLFDARALLRRRDLDRGKLRLSVMVYGALQAVDWRKVRVENITAPAGSVAELLPLLRRDLRPEREALDAWTRQLVDETRALMAPLLDFEPAEREFFERFYTTGEIAPELLTADAAQQAVIREHPGMMSKARAIRQALGLAIEGIVELDAVQRFRMAARWGR